MPAKGGGSGRSMGGSAGRGGGSGRSMGGGAGRSAGGSGRSMGGSAGRGAGGPGISGPGRDAGGGGPVRGAGGRPPGGPRPGRRPAPLPRRRVMRPHPVWRGRRCPFGLTFAAGMAYNDVYLVYETLERLYYGEYVDSYQMNQVTRFFGRPLSPEEVGPCLDWIRDYLGAW